MRKISLREEKITNRLLSDLSNELVDRLLSDLSNELVDNATLFKELDLSMVGFDLPSNDLG